MVWIRAGQARARSRRTRRTLAAVFAFKMRMNTPRVAAPPASRRCKASPAGQRIDGHAEMAAAALIRHSLPGRWGKYFRSMWVSGLISLECTVFRPGCLGLAIAQVADAKTAQAAVEGRARSIWIKDLAHHSQQVVQQRSAASCAELPQRLPAPGPASVAERAACGCGRERCRGDATYTPCARSCRPFRQGPCRLLTGLDRRPYLWCRHRLFGMMDQHGRTPSLMSLRTDLVMKNADRRGAM
jgi:hypothetical protein